jgi:hypothetical protein
VLAIQNNGAFLYEFNTSRIYATPSGASAIAANAVTGSFEWVVPGFTDASGAHTLYVGFQILPSGDFNYSDANTTTNFLTCSIGVANITSDAATRTVTDAATWHIQGAPTAGGLNTTITRSYALWVDAGAIRLDETVAAGSAVACTLTDGPSGIGGNPFAWIKVFVGTTACVVPAWDLP